MNTNALKELLYKMGDDALIMGHRNAEWTGLAPTLEEDISFSSIAQDQIGHALAMYTLLHEHLGQPNPDIIGFTRAETAFTCCHLTELPNSGYDFSLIRHFLFDHAEILRYKAVTQSSFTPLAQVAAKIMGELKYHILHANTWVRQLGNATEEAKARLQTSLNTLFPYALGIFEPSEHEQTLIAEGIFIGENALKTQWLQAIETILKQTSLFLPDATAIQPVYGGRRGYHTEYLQPLLTEMTEVFRIDESAEW
ncbi:phenylacetate-CoA oxygenase subunit PaaI [Sphingobacteriales bacterium UPWRP_1]|nr:phenylacetate-CoA oxygenase subunit PaaI [Sphingobacteriales bacterium TSM_CSM]PSJ75056.1 phenylacetate-CoA oxygenase subunit PaaI [Sphingobacteriales bacterium UPWRP_1]